MSRGGVLRVAGLAILWGSNFLWIKLALHGLSPIQIVFVRMALGGLLLLAYLHVRREALPTGIRLWAHLAAAAVFANVAPYLLFAIGEQQVDSAIAGVLNGTTPLWTIVLAVAVGLEARPSRTKLGGVVIGFVGTVLIFAPWNLGSQIMSWGGLACLLASASYGVSYVYMTRFLAQRGLTATVLSASQLLAATAISGLLVPMFGPQAPHWDPEAIAAVAILGVMGTGVAYVLNYRLITDDGATAASVVTYLVPVVAVGLGAAVLHELPALHVIAGTLIVLGGVALTRRPVQGPSG